MPAQHSVLDSFKIEAELQRRGYGFNANRRAAVQLTKPDPRKGRFRITGGSRVMKLRPVSFAHFKAISERCHSVEEACDQIESISTGRQMEPNFGGNQFDPDVVERVIANRLDNAIASATQPMADQMAQQNATIEDQAATIRALEDRLQKANEPVPRKASKKKGKKAPRRDIVAEVKQEVAASVAPEDVNPEQFTDEQRRANANSDEPILTKSQQEMMSRIQYEGPDS